MSLNNFVRSIGLYGPLWTLKLPTDNYSFIIIINRS